ncbi:unnamed protein product [Clonostachys byssicola]|uniref:Myb-like domain-containing protein n=1 Tax=Clonostachys byssicola TaxID=160290 RepID=A0A9N9UV79_9HYPO|nr:unnamed protein product [Clonostachys byssicola]
MARHTRSSSRQSYPQHLPVELEPSPLSPISPMYNQQRMTLPPAGYYTMPPTTAAGSSSMALGAPQAPPMPGPSYEEVYAGTAAPPIPLPQSHRPSSGAWSVSDDHQLLAARAQGLNWAQIKELYFPKKTGNACRKRHERLSERRDADDWDNRKFQRMAKEYLAMRREIWAPLAARTGEKWQVVEQKCMSSGIKNLQSAARAATRNERLSQNHLASGQPLTGYDDDSGISGIGLTPIDQIDASYNSPETTSPSSDDQHYHSQQHRHQRSSRHLHASSHHAAMAAPNMPMQALGPGPSGAYLGPFGLEAGYGNMAPSQHRYSSSVSSTASAGHGYGNGSQSDTSPYMGSQRLPSSNGRRHH